MCTKFEIEISLLGLIPNQPGANLPLPLRAGQARCLLCLDKPDLELDGFTTVERANDLHRAIICVKCTGAVLESDSGYRLLERKFRNAHTLNVRGIQMSQEVSFYLRGLETES